MCNGILGAIKEVAKQFLDFARGAAEWAISVLVSRPVPTRHGEMELVDRPTNAPMDTVYDLWFSLGLPAGIAVWALTMLLLRASVFLPSGTVSAQRARSLALKGWFLLFFILGSWIWCAFVLHLATGLTLMFAPSGEQIFASFDRIVDSATAAGLAGLLLWLSSGVLFLFVACVFGLSWLAVYVLIPAMPVFIALSLPAMWVFRPLASVGERLQGLFVPCAFIPFPAAVILGVGYPVVNAIADSLDGGLSSFAGVDSFTYIILVFLLWLCAALSPLFLFVGNRRMRSLSALTAGALGAASGMAVASRSGTLTDRLRRSQASQTASPSNAGVGRVDPIAGSPFKRSRDDGGFGGTTIAGELEAATSSTFGSLSTTDSGCTTDAGHGRQSTGSTHSGDSSAQRTDPTTYDTVPSDVTVTKVSDRSALSKERYDAGYFDSRGKYQSLSQGPSNTGWLIDEGTLNRIAKRKPDKTILLYDQAKSEVFDARDLVKQGDYRKGRYEQEHRNTLRKIEETRGT
ncbi:hypothetical protein [Haladaptatus sp. CMAA 1911]|uniref:hypothetical protein n=1 Tax=unclassified Haladaptatus TaxID=2622732 RepID=UPI003754BCD3